MPHYIRVFLAKFRTSVSKKGLQVINREVNREFLRDLKMSPLVRKEIILGLDEKNYSEGPMPDTDGSEGEIWVFGHKFGRKTIYIKLKLDTEAKCISFHLANKKMYFPFDK